MKPGSSNLSLEPQRMKRGRKAGGCNLRKSLAWDKAFFTEEGVLSSLELSMISGTPCKRDGKDFSVIYEEQRTPMHSRINAANFKTIESKAPRKLSFSSTKENKSARENKRIGEGSILKQKSLASVSLTSKKLASASRSGQKDRNCLNNPPLPTSHKRLLSKSPAKPAAQNSKIPRMPVLKPAGHLISTTASSSDASHSKRNRIVPPVDSAPSVQKHLGQKGCFNTRSTSNAPKIVSQRISKPSKSSDKKTRKNRTDSSSPEKSSTNHQVSNVEQSSSSEVISGKVFSVVLKANDGPSKVALSFHANSGNTCIIGQSVQYQAAKPSGLRMPSPSLKFFSEPKISMSNSLAQRNMQPSNLPDSGIPISHNLGATCTDIQSKIPKATMDRIHESGPSQPCSNLSISHNLAAKWKTTMDRVPDSCPVSSINSPKIHDESVQCKNNELVVGSKTSFSVKPLEQISNNSLEEVDKPFLEHKHTSLRIEDADRIDNRSVSPIRECKFNDTVLLQSSGEQLISPGMGKVSDFHFKQGQYDLPVMTKAHGLDSEVEEYSIVQTPLEDDCSVEMPSRISCIKEVQELQCPSHVTDQVPQGYDGLCSNIEEQLERNFSSEGSFQNAAAHNIMEEDKLDKLLVAREALSASLEKVVDTANKQQELPLLQCPLRLMDKPVQCADQNTAKDDAFRIVTNEDKMSDALPLDSALSTSLDTMAQVEDHVDPSISESANDTYGVGQNAHFEPQISPWACKSTCQVDAVICDAAFSFSPVKGLDSTVEQLSMDGIDQQPKNFDELGMELLMPDEATSASLKHKHSSKDLVTLGDRRLGHKEELQFSPSTISGEPLISDQVASGSLEKQHSEDLVGDRELSFQAESQLNPSTCEDQTIQDAAAVYTLEGPSLVNETVRDSLGKDICEKDLVISYGTELIDCSDMEMLLLQNKNENQTANSPAIYNTKRYPPQCSRYECLLLKASGYCSIGVDKLETDSQKNQELQNPFLETQQAENHIILTDSSREDRSSDQTFLKELQLSPRMNEDCTRSSVVICDSKASSSPCISKSVTARNASKEETDEQFESANEHEVFHDTDNEDPKIRPKILKDGKNQPQLVIRPPSDVIPFSDEWLAAIEAAGEELLTLKTGPVQNSPPAKLSPEPGPWSPVKRKNNQGIGPYDCTKYTGGQE